MANGRNVGKHAARIAMLSSRYDQVAASVLFQVGSDKPVAVFNAERRTSEMMQVLNLLDISLCRKLEGNLQEAKAKNEHKHKSLSSW